MFTITEIWSFEVYLYTGGNGCGFRAPIGVAEHCRREG